MEHHFSIEVAQQYGVNAAILLHNFVFWCRHNWANGVNAHEGYYWTYNSAKALQELFPYLGGSQIRSAIQKLLDDGILIKGNYNRTPMDRTMWYAVTEKGYALYGIEFIPPEHDDEPQPEQPEQPEPQPAPEPEINAFGDGTGAKIPDTVEAYCASNLDRMSPGNYDELQTYKQDMPEDMIRHAIDDACGHRAYSWAYVKKILNGYLRKGYKKLGDVLAAEEKAEALPQRPPDRPPDNPLDRAKFY